jgi:ribonuclease HI
LAVKSNLNRITKEKSCNVYTDGASRGNPGLSGAGIVVTDSDGQIIEKQKEFLGEMTNNAAEYSALIKSLKVIRKLQRQGIKIDTVSFFSDSQLIVNQINGIFKVKDIRLSAYLSEFKSKSENLKIQYSVSHIPRKENKLADELANRAIDEREEQLTIEF